MQHKDSFTIGAATGAVIAAVLFVTTEHSLKNAREVSESCNIQLQQDSMYMNTYARNLKLFNDSLTQYRIWVRNGKRADSIRKNEIKKGIE